MIRCQWPEDYITKDIFDALSRFIIPKNEVQEQTITVNSLGYKISGYPTYLKVNNVQDTDYGLGLNWPPDPDCHFSGSWIRIVTF